MSAVPGAKATEAILKAGLPEDVSTVLFKMDFNWSAQNKDRVLADGGSVWNAEKLGTHFDRRLPPGHRLSWAEPGKDHVP